MARHSAVVVALLVAVATLSLAGCAAAGAKPGSAGAGAAGGTPTPSPTKSIVVVTPTPSASVPAAQPGPAAHTLPAATPVNEADYEVPSFGAKGPAFNTPSGNLHCGILDFGASSGYWGCEADQHSWTFAKAAPGDPCYNSEVSCGHGIEAPLGGVVGVLKAGDIHYPGVDPTDYPTKVLPYGYSVSYEGVTCVATSDGVTCIETASGHGFFISRSANDIF